MTKVTRLDDFTEVDMAEGRLLNEIHEHISLGISQALNSLIAVARNEGHHNGFREGYRGGYMEGAERERMRILMERDHVPQDANERVFFIPVCAFSPFAGTRLPTSYGDALPLKGE